jgi:hypothetical protein
MLVIIANFVERPDVPKEAKMNEFEKISQRDLVQLVQRFLFHLSMVNSEAAQFYVHNGRDDAHQQEEYAINWAEKLVAMVDPAENYGLRDSLEKYKDSVCEWAAMRTHASYLMSGDKPLGLQVYEKVVKANSSANLNTDRDLAEMAGDLSITKDEAAYLKAHLMFQKKQ